MGRAPCCEKAGLKRGRWTAEEDQILIKYIAANGEGSWRTLPKNAGLLRCGKSCRLRWINYLRSDLKRGNISTEEEQLIIKLHASLGNRWSLIAGHLPGRTDNEIKNYWNSHLSRKLSSSKVLPESQSDLPSPALAEVHSAQPGSGGKKRRVTTRKMRHPTPNKNKRGRTTDPSHESEPSKQREGDDNVTVLSRPCIPGLSLGKESISSGRFRQGDRHHRHEEDNSFENLIMGPLAEEEASAGLSGTRIQEADDVLCSPEIMCSESAKASTTGSWAVIDDCGLDNNTIDAFIESNTIFPPGGEYEHYNNIVASASSDDGPGKSGGMEASVVGSGEWNVGSPASHGGDEKKLDDWNNWDDWKWDDEAENSLTTVFGDKADILSWLWDTDDNSPGAGDFEDRNSAVAGGLIDHEKHNDTVAWLFS